MDKRRKRARVITQKRIDRRVEEFSREVDSPEKVDLFSNILAQRENIQMFQQKIETDRLLSAKAIILDSKIIENFDKYVAWLGILLDKWAYHDEVIFWVGVLDEEYTPEYKAELEDIIERNCLEKVQVVPYSLMKHLTKGFYSILCAFAQDGEAERQIEEVREAKKSTLFLLAK